MATAIEREFITAKELAELVGVQVQTVYTWIARGLIRVKSLRPVGTNGKRTYRRVRIPMKEKDRVVRRIASGLPLS